MNRIFLFLLLLVTASLSAHQTESSTTLLVEQPDGSWQLHLAASLTAFEYAVETHYGKDAYDTPEAFKDLVAAHLQRSITVRFGEGAATEMKLVGIALGHETKAVYTLPGLTDPEKMEVTNTAFADIHRNRNVLIVLKAGSDKYQLELSADNGHTARLVQDGQGLTSVPPTEASVAYLALPYFILIAGIFLVAGMYRWKQRHPRSAA